MNPNSDKVNPVNPGLEKKEINTPFNSPLDGGKDTNSVISRNYVFLKNLCKSVESVSFVFHFL